MKTLVNGDEGKQDLQVYGDKFKQSWLHEELYKARNFGAAMHKFGMWLGGSLQLDRTKYICGQTAHKFER